MIPEDITSFNFRHYAVLMSNRQKRQVYLDGIPWQNDAVWLGCRTDGGDVAGCLIGSRAGDDIYVLEYLFVKPEYRRCGYGSALMKCLLERFPGKYSTVRFSYTPDFDLERDTFFDFAEKSGFEHRLEKVFFEFDPEILVKQIASRIESGFDIVPFDGKADVAEALQAQKRSSLQAVYAYDPFTDYNAPEMRELRNQVVLTPYGKAFRIVEQATGKEAGFFSCTVCDRKYDMLSTVYIHPEFRPKIHLWVNAVLFCARDAQKEGLPLATFVFYWRSAEIRFWRHFGKKFGLRRFRNTFYFRLKR